MTFPNALTGVKKLYTAQILALIAVIALLLVSLLGLGVKETVNVEEIDAATAVTGGGILLLALAAGIISIIALIMNIVGLKHAKLDEGAFRTALILTIVGLAVSVVSTAVESSNAVVSSFISIAANVLSLAASIFVIKGIVNLAAQLDREDMVEKGNSLLKIIVCLNVVSIAASIVSSSMTVQTESNASLIIAIVASVVSIVSCIVFLSYLSKAKKMLEA